VELVFAFWDGAAWVDLDSDVSVHEDGSVTVHGAVEHFTLFSVQRRPGLRAFERPIAASGVSLAKWGGGSISDAVAAAGPRVVSLWVVRGGRLSGYLPGAPSFANAAFLDLFPEQRLPAGEIVFIVTR
jgi:hypothetical protein